MNIFIILIRGINVGGKNKILMAELRECLEKLGFFEVVTYIASGNVVLKSNKSAEQVQSIIESSLQSNFKLESKIIKVLVLSYSQLHAVYDKKPKGFGEQIKKYRSDVIFLMGITNHEAMSIIKPRSGVDEVWSGIRVIYFQRLDSLRTKSNLNRVISTPYYQSMTIRNWNTVCNLLDISKTMLENNISSE